MSSKDNCRKWIKLCGKKTILNIKSEQLHIAYNYNQQITDKRATEDCMAKMPRDSRTKSLGQVT